jgi:hypothetical protein
VEDKEDREPRRSTSHDMSSHDFILFCSRRSPSLQLLSSACRFSGLRYPPCFHPSLAVSGIRHYLLSRILGWLDASAICGCRQRGCVISCRHTRQERRIYECSSLKLSCFLIYLSPFEPFSSLYALGGSQNIIFISNPPNMCHYCGTY